jgi:hypothetical protein
MFKSLRRSDAGELASYSKASTLPVFTDVLPLGIDGESFRVLGRQGLGGGHDREGRKAHQHDERQGTAAFLARIEAVDPGRDVILVSRLEGFHWLFPQQPRAGCKRKTCMIQKGSNFLRKCCLQTLS